jgi:hypothetical protein
MQAASETSSTPLESTAKSGADEALGPAQQVNRDVEGTAPPVRTAGRRMPDTTGGVAGMEMAAAAVLQNEQPTTAQALAVPPLTISQLEVAAIPSGR